jgi:molybdenum ABC transporter molybdate-binding protein
MRRCFAGILLGLIGCALAAANTVPIQSGTGPTSGVELAVAVSSQLEPAVSEVARAFEQKTGAHVRLVSGASDDLSSQIRKSADIDVFFAADMASPRRLVASGTGVAASLREYGRDGLAMSISPVVRISLPPGNPLVILRDKSIAHISIADPQHTPSGQATEACFRASRIYDAALRRKLLIGKDEAQVAQFLKAGDADVALLTTSATRSYGLFGARTIPIAPNLYRPIRMGAVVMTRSKQRGEGLAFLKFATSPEGRAIFRHDGF